MHEPTENDTRSKLIFCDGSARGWGPIDHLVSLMGSLLDLDLGMPALPAPSRLTTVRHLAFPARRGTAPGAIYVAKSPGAIKKIMALEDFTRPRRFRALWIVDSFWTEQAPPARTLKAFDLVGYMQKGEAAFYERLAPGRTLYLGWGADVLDLGSDRPDRPVDVQRIGRQPEAWDDDERSRKACEAAGLSFAGRPPFLPENPNDLSSDHRALAKHYANAKFVIAHSNLAAPADYTHPRKEYLTGRWTDALAAGATVAGVQPFGDASTEDLLWPGATLDFDRIDLARNVEALKEAAQDWTPARARQNHSQALKRLDWRWRLKALADRLGMESPALAADLARLEAACSG